MLKRYFPACYKVDVVMRELENLTKKPENTDVGARVIQLLDGVTATLGADILVPIYQQYPALNTVMEPGDWYARGMASGRFLFRKSNSLPGFTQATWGLQGRLSRDLCACLMRSWQRHAYSSGAFFLSNFSVPTTTRAVRLNVP